MFKIVGILDKTFTFENNGNKRTVSGFQVFCTDDSRPRVNGIATFDFFMSDSVRLRSDYTPQVGDCLEYISYNRFGKIDRVIPIRD